MHDIVVDQLEKALERARFVQKRLAGFLRPLDILAECRVEVPPGWTICRALLSEFRLILRRMVRKAWSRSRRPASITRVRGRIIEKQQKGSLQGLFSPGAALFSLASAFASLLLLAGLGSFLVTRESSLQRHRRRYHHTRR